MAVRRLSITRELEATIRTLDEGPVSTHSYSTFHSGSLNYAQVVTVGAELTTSSRRAHCVGSFICCLTPTIRSINSGSGDDLLRKQERCSGLRRKSITNVLVNCRRPHQDNLGVMSFQLFILTQLHPQRVFRYTGAFLPITRSRRCQMASQRKSLFCGSSRSCLLRRYRAFRRIRDLNRVHPGLQESVSLITPLIVSRLDPALSLPANPFTPSTVLERDVHHPRGVSGHPASVALTHPLTTVACGSVLYFPFKTVARISRA
jgi:hypothetical protein